MASWLAVIAYAMQIYCDFSGYSDMAIGTAHLFGYRLALNFNMPYLAANVSEFWRRWHISLSSWLRDYLFIPLGGSRGGRWLTCRNLLLTMTLGGLWHGASWTFVLWGLLHGLLLIGHRLFQQFSSARPALQQRAANAPGHGLPGRLDVCMHQPVLGVLPRRVAALGPDSAGKPPSAARRSGRADAGLGPVRHHRGAPWRLCPLSAQDLELGAGTTAGPRPRRGVCLLSRRIASAGAADRPTVHLLPVLRTRGRIMAVVRGTIPTDRHRRAWWTIACAAGALAVLQIVMLSCSLSAAHRDPDYGGRLRRLRQRLRAVSADRQLVVVLGSSRVEQGLFARSLDVPLTEQLGRPVVVANFGRPGQVLLEQLTYERLRRDGMKPNLAVFEILPAWFHEDWPLGDLNPEVLPESRLSWIDLEVLQRHARKQRSDLRQTWVKALPNALYDQRLRLISRFCPGLVSTQWRLSDGRVAEELPDPHPRTPEQRRRGLENARSLYGGTVSGFRLGGPGCVILREILAACRRDGIPTALLLMPEGPEFRGWYGPGAMDHLRVWLNQLTVEFGAPVLNTREWMAEDDFVDSHHLTRDGARRFTARFGEEALLPLLREVPSEFTPVSFPAPRRPSDIQASSAGKRAASAPGSRR